MILHIFLLNNDSEVIKYTGDKAFPSEKAARQFLENYTAYKDYGLGRYAVIHKQSTAYLGWCSLKYDPIENEYDIGFRLIFEKMSTDLLGFSK